ncbi:hypothetical protein Bca4012_058948 [Brassica carinata]
MDSKRFSAAEKGKGLSFDRTPPARTARVKVQEPDNSKLLRKHSLTLIGKVTNKSVQKMAPLIAFFTEHWKTEGRPIGSDLGHGMFQFQFEREADLLAVLEKRPFHFAKWMIILQRWEPTASPDFPSLIPFWIKIEGLPVHLWTEGTLKTIGEDIGFFEKVEITNLAARMRVHVNGRLPLIKESEIEFPNGDVVNVSLHYEKLEKHCPKCLKLDHDFKDCLAAKAEKKALEAAASVQDKSTHHALSHSRKSQPFQFSSSRPVDSNYRASQWRPSNPSYDKRRGPDSSAYSKRSEEHHRRGADRRANYKETRHESYHHPNRHGLAHHRSRFPAPRHLAYREVTKSAALSSAHRDLSPKYKEGSNSSRSAQETSARGIPLRTNLLEHRGEEPRTSPPLASQAAFDEALGEVRSYMHQYASCTDPIESASRKERLRIAEATGQLEKTAATMVRAAHADAPDLPPCISPPPPLERVPAKLRLEPPVSSPPISAERVPTKLRLGVSPPPETQLPIEKASPAAKRKPGRPPGKRKVAVCPSQRVAASPKLLTGTSSHRRKVQQKPTTCRRRLNPSQRQAGSDSQTKAGGSKGSRSMDGGRETISENQPLCNFIPATRKKSKTDFRNPSTPVP